MSEEVSHSLEVEMSLIRVMILACKNLLDCSKFPHNIFLRVINTLLGVRLVVIFNPFPARPQSIPTTRHSLLTVSKQDSVGFQLENLLLRIMKRTCYPSIDPDFYVVSHQ